MPVRRDADAAHSLFRITQGLEESGDRVGGSVADWVGGDRSGEALLPLRTWLTRVVTAVERCSAWLDGAVGGWWRSAARWLRLARRGFGGVGLVTKHARDDGRRGLLEKVADGAGAAIEVGNAEAV